VKAHLIGALVFPLALAGCATAPRDEVATGLANLGDDAGTPVVTAPTPVRPAEDLAPAPGSLEAAAAHNAALDLLAWHDQNDQNGSPPAEAAKPAIPDPASEPEPSLAPSLGPPPPAPEAAPEQAQPEIPLEDRIQRAAEELAGLLREQAKDSEDPFTAAMAMASLEPLKPGVIEELVSSSEALSSAERQTLRAFASVASVLGAPGLGGDPERAAEAFEAAADGLAGSLTIRIGAAELCTRVDGFGQYQAVTGNAFRSMSPHRVIIYTEVDRFGYRPIAEADLGSRRPGPGDRWAVTLTQQLELYNESGAMSAWSRPALPIVETSRNKRRDFHIVDTIELPPNLSIGVYHLRITVKDRATGAQDTRSIPIRIVADPALAGAQK
jgi:hypothetical protein